MEAYINKIICGDALAVLKEMPDEIVNCVVTSPPYWRLRDYGIKGQLGLETTMEEYIEKVVAIFREIRRVLRPDGTLWLNLGDKSIHSWCGNQGKNGERCNRRTVPTPKGSKIPKGLKPKDLAGIPWRIALALQEDGWWLRQDIIWHKRNTMPESVKDRPTRSHEYIFLMSKSKRYYYDYKAIMEPASPDTHARYARGRSDTHKWADGGPGDQTIARSFEHMLKPGVNPKAGLVAPPTPAGWNTSERNHHTLDGRYRPKQNASFSQAVKDVVEYRNKRSVWDIPTAPFKGPHYATFPPRLIEPCILAGCPKDGIVLDPFMGTGTTALMSKFLGRNYIGIELNPKDVKIAESRLSEPFKPRPVRSRKKKKVSGDTQMRLFKP